MVKKNTRMKVGLLLPANIYFCPYAKIYLKILDELKVEYDVLAWNRAGIKEEEGIYIYNKKFPYENGNKLKRIINYYAYSKFLKKQIKANKYDRLIVFGPQVGLFLLSFLKTRYKQKICFDFRDISIEQLFPKMFKRLLRLSSLNVISSLGFKSYLPQEFEYVLSHNFDIDILNDCIITKSVSQVFTKNKINVTTIGAIRDYEQNYQVMCALSNKSNYLIRFIGTPGNAGLKLQQDAVENNFNNVEFIGFYNKKDEPKLLKNVDFLNIYYPKIKTHSTALSNRFYNALIFKKPMIVTRNSEQGMYVEKYKLGLAIESASDLDTQIQKFVFEFNEADFYQNCNKLLSDFREDYEIFKRKFIVFLS